MSGLDSESGLRPLKAGVLAQRPVVKDPTLARSVNGGSRRAAEGS